MQRSSSSSMKPRHIPRRKSRMKSGRAFPTSSTFSGFGALNGSLDLLVNNGAKGLASYLREVSFGLRLCGDRQCFWRAHCGAKKDRKGGEETAAWEVKRHRAIPVEMANYSVITRFIATGKYALRRELFQSYITPLMQ